MKSIDECQLFQFSSRRILTKKECYLGKGWAVDKNKQQQSFYRDTPYARADANAAKFSGQRLKTIKASHTQGVSHRFIDDIKFYPDVIKRGSKTCIKNLAEEN